MSIRRGLRLPFRGFLGEPERDPDSTRWSGAWTSLVACTLICAVACRSVKDGAADPTVVAGPEVRCPDDFVLAQSVIAPKFRCSGCSDERARDAGRRASADRSVSRSTIENGYDYTLSLNSGHEAAFLLIVRCVKSGQVLIGVRQRKNLSAPWKWTSLERADVICSTDASVPVVSAQFHVLIVAKGLLGKPWAEWFEVYYP
ncbi:MAG: hypothetical protein HZA53_18040 [Planctomycetes bacterium]|nr:hypothetical protein [Planctomycetota bacterium]